MKNCTQENTRNCFLPTGSMPTQDGGNNSLIITALNNDDNEATLNIPVPIQAQTAVDLLNSDNETCENNVLPVQNGRLEIKLKGNWGCCP